MKTGIAFLCKKPHQNLVSFAEAIKKKLNFDVFLVIDDNSKNYKFKDVKCFQIKDNECVPYINASAYKGITSLEKNPNAWDKMFYYFLKKSDYDFVWVFEEDVFIPSHLTILNLHMRYKEFDLVTPNNFRKSDTIKDWHWSYLLDRYQPPFYFSMVSAFGMSKNLMNLLRGFVEKNDTLYYHEVMLNTVAMQGDLSVIDAFELKSVVWQGNWGIDEFLLLPNNVFHPIKNLDIHPKLREQINQYKQSNYKPVNKLPDFLR